MSDYWQPAGGYSVLSVGAVAVSGTIARVYVAGGSVQAKGNGNFPQYASDPLESGLFNFHADSIAVPQFNVGDEVTFDIVQGTYAAYAANIHKV